MLRHFTRRALGRHGIAVCTKEPRTLRVFEAADMPESPVPLEIQRRFWDSEWSDGTVGGGCDSGVRLGPMHVDWKGVGAQSADSG